MRELSDFYNFGRFHETFSKVFFFFYRYITKIMYMCGILSLIYKDAHQVVYGLRLISTCRKCRPKTRWNLLLVLLLSDYRGYVTCWFLLRQRSFLFQRDRHRKPKHDCLQCTFITHPLQCKSIQLNSLWLFLIVFLML